MSYQRSRKTFIPLILPSEWLVYVVWNKTAGVYQQFFHQSSMANIDFFMSSNMKDIGVRLRDFRQRSKIKMPAVSASTGIAKETLYKWEKGTKPSNFEDLNKLKVYLDKEEGKLEEEAFEIEKQKPATLRLPLNNTRSAVPQTDGKAASGTVIFTEDGPELIVARINAPFLGVVEGVIDVTDCSMEPKFCNGCRITITRLHDFRVLTWGQYYYIIDKNWQGIVRRIYQCEKENCIWLVSDNPDQEEYPPIMRSLDQIEAIFKVGAAIIKCL